MRASGASYASARSSVASLRASHNGSAAVAIAGLFGEDLSPSPHASPPDGHHTPRSLDRADAPLVSYRAPLGEGGVGFNPSRTGAATQGGANDFAQKLPTKTDVVSRPPLLSQDKY
eukprot:3276386-Pyramimonas_sp.AAC.1